MEPDRPASESPFPCALSAATWTPRSCVVGTRLGNAGTERCGERGSGEREQGTRGIGEGGRILL